MDLETVWDDKNQNANSNSEKARSISLESGLENIETWSSPISRNEKDFIIAELKEQYKEKESEIIRLKSVESNYGQAKQQLKDTKWMLKVRFFRLCVYQVQLYNLCHGTFAHSMLFTFDQTL